MEWSESEGKEIDRQRKVKYSDGEVMSCNFGIK